MPSILISINPKWVAKILNGEKTIEIRKTAPKCELPCEVYIYCTKGKEGLWYVKNKTNANGRAYIGKNVEPILNGKVVAKFTLWKINKYRCRVYIPEDGITIPHKVKLESESEYPSTIANKQNWDWEEPKLIEILSKSRLTEKELAIYLSRGLFKCFYAWEISELKVYDKPRELSDFWSTWQPYMSEPNLRCKRRPLKRPPQSWCFVKIEPIEWSVPTYTIKK